MKAGKYNLEVEQGATFFRVLTIKSPGNTPIDITGWQFRGQLRKNVGDTAPVAALSFVILDQEDFPGQVEATMSNTVTAAIVCDLSENQAKEITKFVYDIEAVKPDGMVLRLLEGVANVSPEVTR